MAKRRKICNLEVYDQYFKKFNKSDWEAAGLFLSDEGLLSETADVNKLKKHWANRMGMLRRKWSRLNRSKRLKHQTKEAFLLYQEQVFYEPMIILNHQDTS